VDTGDKDTAKHGVRPREAYAIIPRVVHADAADKLATPIQGVKGKIGVVFAAMIIVLHRH
jgi:hypothetical protein